MMDESSISHYAKRIVLIDHYLGDGNYHTDRLIDLLVEENAAA